MKRLSLLLIGLIPLCALAQQVDRPAIIGSDEYYYGTGTSYDVDEARDRALSELTSQIAIHVASSFEEKLGERDGEVSEEVQSILKTHSAATLKNVQMVKQPARDGRIEVFCYLKKTEVERIFTERRRLIANMVEKADGYGAERNYAYALKLYYFAALLLNSLPDQNVFYEGVNYTTEIPEKINRTVLSTTFEFVGDRRLSEKEREVTLKVGCDGNPISLLDFKFWDGANQISVQARDGLASFRLVGGSVAFEELKLSIKTAYYECRKEYSIVETLWEVVSKPTFHTLKTVLLKPPSPVEVLPSAQEAMGDSWDVTLDYEDEDVPSESIGKEIVQLLGIMEDGDAATAKQHYAKDAFLKTKVSDYLVHNHPAPLDRKVRADVNRTSTGWEVRSIRMLHRYPSIHKESTEYLVLDFSETGKLVDLNLSITGYLYDKFVKAGALCDDWGNRQEIIKFLEKYRTAYMTRDRDTVGLMFAEDALIIVGRKIEKKKLPPDMVKYEKLGNQPDYEYIKLTKEQYLTRQQQIFEAQEDILLDFASFDMVSKTNSPNVYGVEMRQSYTSTTYADEGYLFLLIDFNEEDPLIYVRAWQPNAWDKEELIRTANFRVYN